MGEYLLEEEKKRKVLIINTGGTIGSKYTEQGISILTSEIDKSITRVVHQVTAR